MEADITKSLMSLELTFAWMAAAYFLQMDKSNGQPCS